MSDLSDLELLGKLGVELEPEKPKAYSPLEARLIAGFEDILKFAEEHGRPPQHDEERDIFERLYAVRLDQLRKNKQAQPLLTDFDVDGLLTVDASLEVSEPDDDALLKELGIDPLVQSDDDITKIKHVAPMAHRQAAEEIANRELCRDFDKFEPIFKNVKSEIHSGTRITIKTTTQDDFDVGRFFILKGQMAYIAERGKDIKATGKNIFDARLRVVFDNGTESNLLMRSLQRSFNNPQNNARAISVSNAGPLFSDSANEDTETGTIYVLRSKSELPEVAPIRDAILKIGVSGGSVKTRISNAKNEATYLLGDVEIIDEYTLYNVNRKKLESLVHQIFSDAQLQIFIKDRFGKPFSPREWFLVTPSAVAEAVELIKSTEIKNYRYDVKSAKFLKID